MEKNKMIPIGTVCEVKNEKIMIIGYNYNSYENGIKTYDYVACKYPEGLMNLTQLKLLNSSEITNVLYEGFKSPDFSSFQQQFFKEDNTNEDNNQEYVFDMNGIVIADKKQELAPSSTYEFDKNGTVISDGKEATKLQTSPYIFDENGVIVAENQNRISTPNDGTVVPIENSYKFENGVVVADGRTVPTESPYKFENGVVVADGRAVPTESPYKFENGVVVADGKEATTESPYKFENGVVVADGKAVPTESPYKFENGVVVADGKEATTESPYKFENGVVVADGVATA